MDIHVSLFNFLKAKSHDVKEALTLSAQDGCGVDNFKLGDVWIPPWDSFIYVVVIYNLLTSRKDFSQLAKSYNTCKNPILKFFDVKIILHKLALGEFLVWFPPPCLIHFSSAIAWWFSFFEANLTEQLTLSEMLWFYFGLCWRQRFWLWFSHLQLWIHFK